MDIFQNLDLLSVGFTVAATTMLGFIVYFNNSKSITSKTFFAFAFISSMWGSVNYISYQTQNPVYVLWLIRMVIFFAIWQAYTLFLFIYVFPKDNAILPFWVKKLLFWAVIFTSILTLTPLVFSDIKLASSGQASQPVLGLGIVIFAIVAVLLVLMGIVLLLRKVIVSTGDDRKRLMPVLIGAGLMFLLIITFNLIAVVVFKNVKFIPFGAFFVFPFILLTSYSVLKHKLFNIKVAWAGVLVFLLAVVSFSEIIFAKDLSLILYRSSIFLLILIFGVMFIKNILKEVRMREKLQKLYGDLKLANEKLKKLDEEKSEFLSIASHQIRTPMTVIKGYISMIFEGSFGDFSGKLKEILNRIYISNERLIKLIDDLLDISRIERGKMIFSFKKQSFEKIVSDIVKELKPIAEQKNINIIWEPENKNFPDVLIDENYIRQVILNLTDNAIKYSNKGSITLNLETKESSLLFSIKDNGIGISSDVMPFLFQRYSRGEHVYTEAAEGMGLGLYVAKKIIDSHRGKIWAESEGVSRGATFFVELPVIK